MHGRIYSEGIAASSFTADGAEMAVQGMNVTRFAADLSACTRARISTNLYSFSGPAPSATLVLEWSDDDGVSWSGTNVSVTVDDDGLFVGEYANLPAGLDADTIFRITTSDETGNSGAAVWPVFIDFDAK